MLDGVYAAAITPRREGTLEVDLGAMLELVDFLNAAKVRGIVLFGSTGEFPHFSLEDRAKVLALAVKRSRLPVIANVSHSTFDGSITLAGDAIRAGAAAMLLMPPHFFRYSQNEIRDFYLSFAAEAGGRVPTLLYNIPAFTNPLACATSIGLLETGLFAGIKDSSGDLEAFRSLEAAAVRLGFCNVIGNDVIYRQARGEGADGIVSGVACAVPELLLALDRAVVAGDGDRAGRLDARLAEILDRLEDLPTPAGIREAVSVRKLKAGVHAVPPSEHMAARLAAFREWFRGWLFEVLRDAA